jgi:hypothetical protein
MSDGATSRSDAYQPPEVCIGRRLPPLRPERGLRQHVGLGEEEGVVQALQGLPGESVASAVSADGRTVTGLARDAAVAFLWEATTA